MPFIRSNKSNQGYNRVSGGTSVEITVPSQAGVNVDSDNITGETVYTARTSFNATVQHSYTPDHLRNGRRNRIGNYGNLAEITVVAGGAGGAGGVSAGGGGAGGILSNAPNKPGSIDDTVGTYLAGVNLRDNLTFTVGTGSGSGTDGSPSTMISSIQGTFTADGGGSAPSGTAGGHAGGSGGGGSASVLTPAGSYGGGNATTGQGNAGSPNFAGMGGNGGGAENTTGVNDGGGDGFLYKNIRIGAGGGAGGRYFRPNPPHASGWPALPGREGGYVNGVLTGGSGGDGPGASSAADSNSYGSGGGGGSAGPGTSGSPGSDGGVIIVKKEP